MSEEFKEYKYNKTYLNIVLGLMIFSICFLIFTLFLFRGRMFISNIGLLMPILMYFIFRKYVVITLFDQHFIYKLAPLRAARRVEYTDLEGITRKRNRIILQFKNGKKLPLHLGIINKNEREELENRLKAKVGSL